MTHSHFSSSDGPVPGWPHLPEPPGGLPDVDRIRVQDLAEELASLEAHIAQRLTIAEDDPGAKAMAFVLERIRRRIWMAAEAFEELSPQALAAELGVTDQTIRDWCQSDSVPVHYRKKGSRYVVDAESARAYAARDAA